MIKETEKSPQSYTGLTECPLKGTTPREEKKIMYNFVYDRSTPLKLYSRKGTGVHSTMIVSLSLKIVLYEFLC